MQLVALGLILAQLETILIVNVECASGVADSYPVVVEAGEDSFLILNDDEVANAEILQKLSGASKEEVEEIVDSNPHVQEMILSRIKSAVDKRKGRKAKGKVPVVINKAPVQKQKQKQQQLVYGKVVGKTVAKVPAKIDFVDQAQEGGEEVEEEEEGEDEEEDEEEQRIAAWRKELQDKKAKLFKIGHKFKAKLMKFSKKKDSKKRKKAPPAAAAAHSSWPHFHYSVTTS